jgi:hypothetical protein
MYELFHFCELNIVSLGICVLDGSSHHRHMFQYTFGSERADVVSDTFNQTPTRDVFTALHELYVASGRPLRQLHYLEAGGVDRFHPASGVYFFSGANTNPTLGFADYFVNDRMANRKVENEQRSSRCQAHV